MVALEAQEIINNGEWCELGKVSKVEITNTKTEEIEETTERKIRTFNNSRSFTAPIELTKQSTVMLLHKTFCKSNNWLRMHGYPMKKKR